MKKRWILTALLIIIIAAVCCAALYLNDYYHAESGALKYINGTDTVSVEDSGSGLFLDGPGNDTALIFYPGAKVEYTSYLPLLSRISAEGIDCFLVEMPFNIAFFAPDSADNIIDNYNYTHYYMAGHSLGGTVASNYVNNHNTADGVILFASYSTDKIEKPVLSVYGSEDKVLNHESYDEFKSKMADGLSEVVIEGGNHAQTGDYGSQDGDGKAKITPENQQKQSADAVIDFIQNLK